MRTLSNLFVLLVICALTACATAPEKRQSAGEYLDDSVITTKVKTALLGDDQVRGLSITVNTFNGVVQLGGFVNSKAEIRRAGKLAAQIRGVRAVKNDLILKQRN